MRQARHGSTLWKGRVRPPGGAGSHITMTNTALVSRVVVLMLAMLPGLARSGFLDELNILIIENQAGSDIQHLFVSPANSRHHGADILGPSAPLKAGGNVTYFIHYPNRCGRFDIHATAANGSFYRIEDFEVCDGKSVVARLTDRHVGGKAPATDFVSVVFENGSGTSITSFFFTPGDSETWGIDVLNVVSALRSGDELKLRLPRTDGDVIYAARAVDNRHRTYSFSIEIPGNGNVFVFEILPDWIDD